MVQSLAWTKSRTDLRARLTMIPPLLYQYREKVEREDEEGCFVGWYTDVTPLEKKNVTYFTKLSLNIWMWRDWRTGSFSPCKTFPKFNVSFSRNKIAYFMA